MKFLNRKVTSIITTVLITGTLLAGCGTTDAKQTAANGSAGSPTGSSEKTEAKELVKIRYGTATEDAAWALLAEKKGFFKQLEDQGIDLEIVQLNNGGFQALQSGEVDITDCSTTDAIVAAGKGGSFKIVANMYRSMGPFYLVGQPGIEKIEDLKGKKVGVGTFGGGYEVFLRAILKKHGLDADKDVKMVNNAGKGWVSILASLEANQVAASMIEEPAVTVGESKGTIKLLAKGWDYLPTFHTGVLAATDKVIKEHPDQLKAVVKFYFDTYKYAKQNQYTEWLDFLTEFRKIDREVQKKSLEREDPIWDNNAVVDLKRIEETQQIQIDLGLQKEKYDVSKFIDNRFAE